MAEVRVLLALGQLLVLALAFGALGVRPSLAPLCAVGTVVGVLALAGCFGVLRLGGWLLWVLVLAAAAFVAVRALRGKRWPRLSFGLGFFAVASLGIILLLWAKQPMFTEWDEFSFWGVGGKLLKEFDQLYTTAPVGWAWTQTQKPALIVFSYFFQFLGHGFAEWQTLVAVDVFLLACMAAVLAPLDEKRRQVGAAFPLAVVLALLPFVFYHYETAGRVSPAYLNTLGDLPLGFAFGGALAAWFGGEKRRPAGLLPVCLGLLLTTMTKDTGFALALVAAVLVAADSLLCAAPRLRASLRTGWKNTLWRLAAMVGTVAAGFGGWEMYLKVVSGADRAEAAGSTAAMGIAQMPLAFVKELFSSPKRPLFNEVVGGMAQQFVFSRGNMLGSGLLILLLVWVLLAAACFLRPGRPHLRRCVVFGVGSTLGFAAWYALIAMSYLYVLRPEQARMLESIDRYVFPYYVGWLLAALCLFARALAGAGQRRAALGQLALVGLAAALLLRVGQLVPAHYTVLGAHPDEYNARRVFSQRVQGLRRQLHPGGKTFLVMCEDSGIGWFMYCHEMLPWQMDYSYGGGAMEERRAQPDGTTQITHVTAEMWEQHLKDTGCTTVYIDYATPDFMAEYGGLFADGMEAYRQGQTNLYEVTLRGGRVVLVPAEDGA